MWNCQQMTMAKCCLLWERKKCTVIIMLVHILSTSYAPGTVLELSVYEFIVPSWQHLCIKYYYCPHCTYGKTEPQVLLFL